MITLAYYSFEGETLDNIHTNYVRETAALCGKGVLNWHWKKGSKKMC